MLFLEEIVPGLIQNRQKEDMNINSRWDRQNQRHMRMEQDINVLYVEGQR